jgi:hypothetical protein
LGVGKVADVSELHTSSPTLYPSVLKMEASYASGTLAKLTTSTLFKLLLSHKLQIHYSSNYASMTFQGSSFLTPRTRHTVPADLTR